MQTTSFRRPAALALILATITLTAAGCDRRDSPSSSSNQGSTTGSSPSTTNQSTMPGSAASAASR